ncbi:unnamed protein product [Fraxinus pennsylvanica]|uniref:DUF668 domain-containing protein n=1 Tax=Fraxinus pennsylvanica TaxID=56036 RepID=A0AAD1ZLY6_9LAMI|nr:unnamed protein product [Fraxinus pennsylvanica]
MKGSSSNGRTVPPTQLQKPNFDDFNQKLDKQRKRVPFQRNFLMDRKSEDRGLVAKNNRVFHATGSSTVGGSGLAIRYTNVIHLAEKYLDSAALVDHEEHESLYQMLQRKMSCWLSGGEMQWRRFCNGLHLRRTTQ